MFVDEVKIRLESGKGGPGCVSFFRERFVTKGGPDGGDGGHGGNVWIEVDDHMNSLLHLRFQNCYAAENGRHGEGRKKSGRKGEDLIIKVPRGTVVRDQSNGELIVDFNMDVDKWLILDGGKGGRGNVHFKSSTHQSPREFEEGTEGEALDLELTLKLIADVGLVGFPNAGKSSLLSKISLARPKVADYPFTTMTPHLGTHQYDALSSQVVFADIPGLIEGASEGKGLGIKFLKHIERTKMILHLVEPFHDDGESPVEKIKAIRRELHNYSEILSQKKELLVLSKMDLMFEQEDLIAAWEQELGAKFIKISTATGEGIDHLLQSVRNCLEDLKY